MSRQRDAVHKHNVNVKYQANSSCGIMSVILLILMTTLFYKALILQGEMLYWSLLRLRGLPEGFTVKLLTKFYSKICKNEKEDHRRTGNFWPGGGGAVNHLPKHSCKLPKFLQNSRKETRAIRCSNIGRNGLWKWLETVFSGSSLSINYIAINIWKNCHHSCVTEIKMKICSDQGSNDIGVVIATKWRPYLLYLQQFFSLGTVLTK